MKITILQLLESCFITILLLTCFQRTLTQLQFIKTIAGTGALGFSGDNGPATSANILNAFSSYVDTNGNIFIVDTGNYRIRKVDAITKIITTVVGFGLPRLLGDGGPATSACIINPRSIWISTTGKMYFTDTGNNRIRTVSPTGIITTYAGMNVRGHNFNGQCSGDGYSAISALVGASVSSLVVDTIGNIYIAETSCNRVRRIGIEGNITTFAGTSSSGYNILHEGIAATLASLNNPIGLAIDSNGNLYIGDAGNYRIRKVVISTGIITTIAGVGLTSSSNGPATSVGIPPITSLWVNSNGELYFNDDSRYGIRKLDINGIVSIFAGNGASGSIIDNTLATSTPMNIARGIIGDINGNIYFSHVNYFKIYCISSSTNIITAIAGTGSSNLQTGFTAPYTSIGYAYNMYIDTNGYLYLSDRNLGRITRINIYDSKSLSVNVAGNGEKHLTGEFGPATSAGLGTLEGIYGDSVGNIYVVDRGHYRIRKLNTETGIIASIVGNIVGGMFGAPTDNVRANETYLYSPLGITGDSNGNIYVSDFGNYRIRCINYNTKMITTIGGTGYFNTTHIDDVGPATLASITPYGIHITTTGILYFTDYLNNRIRKINSEGIISTVIGNSLMMLSGDGGPAINATVNRPYSVWVDSSIGSIYIADTFNHRIRKIDGVTGIITTFAGKGSTGYGGYNGDNIMATNAFLQSPQSVYYDPLGNTLYIADSNNYRIRQVNMSTMIITATYPNNGTMTSAQRPTYIHGDALGNLYISQFYSISKITLSTRRMVVIAGTGVSAAYNGDGMSATLATINLPKGVFITTSGTLYFADQGNGRIRKVTGRDGIISTVAGNSPGVIPSNGVPATSVSINGVYGIFVDTSGNLYFSESSLSKIFMINSNNTLNLVAGSGTGLYSSAHEGIPATSASLSRPLGIWLDSMGNLFIADNTNRRIRKIATTTNIITTYAGNGLSVLSGDDGPATAASFGSPDGIWGDTIGNIFVADSSNSRIRRIDALTKIITTIAGYGMIGVFGTAVDNGPATNSGLYSPFSVVGDSTGRIYISDRGNYRIRTIFSVAYPTSQPTSIPSQQPFSKPSTQPTSLPSSLPSIQPTACPSNQPTLQPSSSPTLQPFRLPTSGPTGQPISSPSGSPSSQPSCQPSIFPTSEPSCQPTKLPTRQPSTQPSVVPSSNPSFSPTVLPSSLPSMQPSCMPSMQPILHPSTQPSSVPSIQPTDCPSSQPTHPPTRQPSSNPTVQPTTNPSVIPSSNPSIGPTTKPTSLPSSKPISQPTLRPSSVPSSHPSKIPLSQPTNQPSSSPSSIPSFLPSSKPTSHPSCTPTTYPSTQPTQTPISLPTVQPTSRPSIPPSSKPSSLPSVIPTIQPSSTPTKLPTIQPSTQPSSQPSLSPNSVPTWSPSNDPSRQPSSLPSMQPTSQPSVQPLPLPTGQPFSIPTMQPTTQPSVFPSKQPITNPTSQPSTKPSTQPLSNPTLQPTLQPSLKPTAHPSVKPSEQPTGTPTRQPTLRPTQQPISEPTSLPSTSPKAKPSSQPSSNPTNIPSSNPTKQPVISIKAPNIVSIVSIATLYSIKLNIRLESDCMVHIAIYVAPSLPLTNKEIRNDSIVSLMSNSRSLDCVIDNLIPATEYVIYIVTESIAGNLLSFDDASKSKSIISTSCCRAIYWSVTDETIVVGKDLLNFANIYYVALSEKAHVIPVSLVSNNTRLDSSSNLVPSTIIISESSTESMSSTLVSLRKLSSAGKYYFSALLPLDMQEQYSFIAADSTTEFGTNSSMKSFNIEITVVSDIEILPAPQMSSAMFGNDGTYFDIEFDRNTNHGGQSTSFTCSAIFLFSCADVSRCMWLNDKLVRAFVSNKPQCAAPGSSVALIPSAKLRSLCTSSTTEGIYQCSTWPISDVSRTLVISMPLSPISPQVVMTLPSAISTCGNVFIDLSQSFGHGGRDWYNSSLDVQIIGQTSGVVVVDDGYIAQIEKSFTPLFPLKLNSSRLISDTIYTFRVQLCNFLGRCSQATKSTIVSSSAILSVTIAGDSVRSITPAQVMSLSAIGSIVQCGSQNTWSAIDYRWTIYDIENQVFIPVTASRDPSKLVVPKNTLSANTQYLIEVIASIGGLSSSATINVNVVSGSLALVFDGGTIMRTLRVGSSITLDASQSYDENISNRFGLASGLIYGWSCRQTEPELNSTCSSVLSLSATDSEILVISTKPSSDVSGSSVLVSLTITSSQDSSRSVSSSIPVVILPSLAVMMAITSNVPTSAGKINVDKQVQIYGKVSLPPGLQGSLQWTVDDGDDIDLSKVTSTVLTKQITASTAIQTINFNLVINKNSLTGGVTYKFRLLSTLMEPGVSTSTAIAIEINAAPQPGYFIVTPNEGYELSDIFAFSCSNWQDSDLPLSYQFSYNSPSGSIQTVRSKLESPFTSVILPAGSSSYNYNVTCIVDVYDSLSSKTTKNDWITVRPVDSTSSTAINFLNYSLSVVSSSATIDTIKQGLVIASAILNRADCTLTPDCARLRRSSCYSTNHTCGECYSGYIGDSGNANTMCWTVDEVVTAIQSVDNSASKTCLQDCSGHGKCLYYSTISGQTISDCAAYSIDCTAECSCSEGYGGNACQYTSDELQERYQYRNQLILGALRVLSLDDSSDTVEETISSINEICLRSDEVSVDTADTISSSLNATLSSISSSFETSTMDKILDTVDLVATVYVSNELSARRRLIETAKTSRSLSATANKGDQVLNLLQTISSKYAQSMVSGQSDVNLLRSHFKLQTSIEEVANVIEGVDCNSTIIVSLPQTVKEQILKQPANTLTVPKCRSNTSSLTLSGMKLSSTLFAGDEYEGDPLALHLSEFPCDDAQSCHVTLIMSRNDPQSITDLIGDQTITEFTFQCNNHDYRQKVATCPDGNQVYFNCDGTSSVVKVSCPSKNAHPTCSLAGSESHCERVSYTIETVTCRCSVLPLSHGRKLLQGNVSIPSGELSVNYVSMLEVVSQSFVTTVISAQSLNADTVGKSWESLVVISSLGVAVIFFMLFGHHLDGMAYKEMSSVSPMRQQHRMRNSFTDKVAALRDSLLTIGNHDYTKKNHLVQANRKSPGSMSFLKIAEEALPQVLSSRSYLVKFQEELKRHHRWMGVIFFFTKKFPRALRVLSLATNIITMLFIQSITYNLTNGDDGSCEQLQTETSCLEPKSSFSAGNSKCYWVSTETSDPTSGDCYFIQPDSDLNVIVFVAICSAVLSTPIAFTADWIITNVLAAPTKEYGVATSPTPNAPGLVSVVPFSANITPLEPPVIQKATVEDDASKDFKHLQKEVSTYRSQLTDKTEFDAVWGLDKNGKFRTEDTTKPQSITHQEETIWSLLKELVITSLLGDTTSTIVADVVLTELQTLHLEYHEEQRRFQDEFLTEKEKSKRLLFLFQKDLMPGISGQILDSKGRRDDIVVLRSRSRSAKWVGWFIITILNIGMLFYIFLFAVSQEVHRQRAWAKSFGLWLAVEVFVVSSVIVFFMHVLIPSLILTDVNKVRQRLISSLQDYHRKMANAQQERERTPEHALQESLFDEAKEDSESQSDQHTRKRDNKKRSSKGSKHSSKSSTKPSIKKYSKTDTLISKKNKKHKKENMKKGPIAFNAAEYLFLSTKLARLYPELRVAQIIGEFSTPWPKQSYHHVSDVTKEYDRKFQAITKSVTMVLMFFVTSFISIPPSLQDMLIHMSTTAISGYTALLHMRLYQIYPVLVVVPTVIVALIIHFFVQSNKRQRQLEVAKIFGNVNPTTVDMHQVVPLSPSVAHDILTEHVSDSIDKHVVASTLDRRQSIAQGVALAMKADDLLHQLEKVQVVEVIAEDSEDSHEEIDKFVESQSLPIVDSSAQITLFDGFIGAEIKDEEIFKDPISRVEEDIQHLVVVQDVKEHALVVENKDMTSTRISEPVVVLPNKMPNLEEEEGVLDVSIHLQQQVERSNRSDSIASFVFSSSESSFSSSSDYDHRSHDALSHLSSFSDCE